MPSKTRHDYRDFHRDILETWDAELGGICPTSNEIDAARKCGYDEGDAAFLSLALGFRRDGATGKQRAYANGGLKAENDGGLGDYLRKQYGSSSIPSGVDRPVEVNGVLVFVRSNGGSHRKLSFSASEQSLRFDASRIDLAEIDADTTLPETTREALIDARLGQGKFRSQLDARWNNACAVTGCTVREVLRASHIKPWRDCSNKERLDPCNGILLSANLDALFDRGLISFDDDGKLLISKRVSDEIQKLGLSPSAKLRIPPDSGQKRFLAGHRKAFQP